MTEDTRCERCGEPFVQKARRQGGGLKQKWCSPKCRTIAWSETNREHERKMRKIWSEANRERNNARRNAYRLAHAEKEKARVKAWIEANRDHQRKRQAAYHAAHLDEAKAMGNKRRSMKRAAPAEAVTLTYLLERDGFRCGVCRKTINVKRRYPDPLSASIDHIVPISKGGSGLKANLRPAHLRCNLSKGDRVSPGGDQLLLVG